MSSFAALFTLLALGTAAAQTRLELNKPISAPIRAGEVQRVEVTATTGSFVRASIRQEGLGVNVRGFFPDGSKIRAFAGPNTGTKSFRFVIEMPGIYQLELTGLPGGAPRRPLHPLARRDSAHGRAPRHQSPGSLH